MLHTPLLITVIIATSLLGAVEADLEQRVKDLEARVAALEVKRPQDAPTAPPKSTPADNAAPKAAIAKQTIPLTTTKKAISKGQFGQESIYFDFSFASPYAKPVRALKGVLEFRDVFDSVKMRLNYTMTDELPVGGTTEQKGIGFEYNQFMDNHRWVYSTELKDMRLVYQVNEAIFNE